MIAGVNGAGKSSVIGEVLKERGAEHYDPDAAAKTYLAAHPDATQSEANARAWTDMRDRLVEAIAHGTEFAFETTLGGNTITELLLSACEQGRIVRVAYIGLSTPELHIERVAQRVAAGGHDIPEGKIRERFDSSRRNLVRLVPYVDEIRLWDNSEPVDIATEGRPEPQPICRYRATQGAPEFFMAATQIPSWSKAPIAAILRRGHRSDQ